MTWDITKLPKFDDLLKTIEPIHVLDELDGPMLFTMESKSGLLLIYLCTHLEQGERYIVTSTSNDIINALSEDRITLRKSLDQPLLWIVDTRWTGEAEECAEHVIDCRRASLNDVPECNLPALGVMLRS